MPRKSIDKLFFEELGKQKFSNETEFRKAVVKASKVLPKFRSINSYQQSLQRLLNETNFDKDYKNCLFEDFKPGKPIADEIKETYANHVNRKELEVENSYIFSSISNLERLREDSPNEREAYRNDLVAIAKQFKNVYEYQQSVENKRNIFQKIFYGIFGDPIKKQVEQLKQELSKTDLGVDGVSEILASKNDVKVINKIVNRSIDEAKSAKDYTDKKSIQLEDSIFLDDYVDDKKKDVGEPTITKEKVENASYDFSAEEIKHSTIDKEEVYYANVDPADVDIEMVANVDDKYINPNLGGRQYVDEEEIQII